MTDQVTPAEIADLTHRIRALHEHRPVDPFELADILDLKADLLTRIAVQRAAEYGPCHYTAEAATAAAEAVITAEQAHQQAWASRPDHQATTPTPSSTTLEVHDAA
jgi:hypothetical protein